jgi:shikimate kinase
LDIGNKLKKHIFLTGFMGSGKSTIGKNLATQLQVKFVDTDDRIEAQYNIEIKEIFQEQGESRFREYEESMLDEIIEKEKPAIISLGGGTLLSQVNLKKALSSGVLIYIKSSPTEIWNRIKHSTRRPLLRKDGEEWTKKMYLARIAELMKEREQGYEQAHLILDRDGKEVEEIIEELLKKI